jgi:hypothetical protein
MGGWNRVFAPFSMAPLWAHTHTCAQGTTVTACALAGQSHQGALEKLLFFPAHKNRTILSLALSLCAEILAVSTVWGDTRVGPTVLIFLPPRAERIPTTTSPGWCSGCDMVF